MSNYERKDPSSLRFTEGRMAKFLARMDRWGSIIKRGNPYEMWGIHSEIQPLVDKGQGEYRYELHPRRGGEHVLYHAPDGSYPHLDDRWIVDRFTKEGKFIDRKRLSDSPEGFVEIERPWTGRNQTLQTLIEWKVIEERKKQSSSNK
jgi:hypothetical protein